MEDKANQRTVAVTDLEQFPPTVTGHDTYKKGVDLTLLDSGTEEEPRFIRIFDDDRDTEAYNL